MLLVLTFSVPEQRATATALMIRRDDQAKTIKL
jgi:hypothetical protein